MRLRKEIERDFNNAMAQRREEFLLCQREKLQIEVSLDIREQNGKLISLLLKNQNPKKR